MNHLDSDPETPPELNHPIHDQEYSTNPAHEGERHPYQEEQDFPPPEDGPTFRLTLSSMRGDLDQVSDDQEEDYTSEIASESPVRTPPESTDNPHADGTDEELPSSHLDVDRNSVAISERSSLNLRLSFHPGPYPDEVSPQATTPPDTRSSEKPHLSFLASEIDSTWSSGEEFTHRMLVFLWDFFACSGADEAEDTARLTADNLHRVNEEYLLTVSAWEVFERDEELQGFLWLVWTCLLEVIVRMDYRDDDEVEVVVGLVAELLRPGRGRRRAMKIRGKDGRTWTGSQIPTFESIWHSAYVGFSQPAAVESSYPIEAAPEEWIACYSFFGRLTGAGLADSWELEVWALDEALGELTWEGRAPSRTSECLVTAAAEFVKHAGDTLAVAGAKSRGWLRAFGMAKWNHWMERFGEVANLFDSDGPGPVQWASWFAREHMLVVGEKAGFT